MMGCKPGFTLNTTPRWLLGLTPLSRHPSGVVLCWSGKRKPFFGWDGQVGTAAVRLCRHSCWHGSPTARENSSFTASEVLAQDCHRFCADFMPRDVSNTVRVQLGNEQGPVEGDTNSGSLLLLQIPFCLWLHRV